MKFRRLIWVVLLFILGLTRVFSQTIPHRVISLSPNFTEIVYDIGAQDQLVGVTNYCKFPPEATKKEKVGGWVNPNIEKIVSLKPDLILVPSFFGKNYDRLQKLDLPILAMKCYTTQDVLALYDLIGEKMGRESAAKKAKDRLEKRLGRLKGHKSDRKPLSVLFIVNHVPGALQQLYAVGSNNFINELIQWTGGVNVLEDSKLTYPIVSKEEMVSRDPDVIITVLPPESKKEDEKNEQKIWSQMSTLKAVREGHLYFFQGDDLMIPGPTMLHLAQLLSDAFEKTGMTQP